MAGGLPQGNGRGGGRIISDINVTPFVDVMLVLLVIFMVTATYIVRDSLDVNLPEASTGNPQEVSLLGVVLRRDGEMQLNGQRASEADLRRFIDEQKGAGQTLEAVIAADKQVPHGRVVRIIDLVRAEGIEKFAITVLKPGEEG